MALNRRLQKAIRFASSTVIASLLTVGVAPNAFAAGCSGYQYAGKYTLYQSWNGAAGDISTDSETLPGGDDTDYHILNYTDMNDGSSYWIQTGNGLGYTGEGSSYCQNSTIQAYMELSDVNSYLCLTWTAAQIGLTQETFFEVYNTGECASNDDHAVAWVYDGSWIQTGGAYFPGCGTLYTNYGQTEFDEFNYQTGCPAINGSEYFGYGSNSLQELNSSYNWVYWTTGETHGPDAPLTITPTSVNSVDQFYVNS
jgi:hypothetical protein